MTCLWKSANNADSHKPLGFAAFPTGPTAGMHHNQPISGQQRSTLRPGIFCLKNGETLQQIPEQMRARLDREYQRLELVEAELRELEAMRRIQLRQGQSAAMKKVQQLTQLRGIGTQSAWVSTMEFFGWRQFRTRREVGGALGFTPTPYQSGDKSREQGISRAGNKRMRVMAIEMAWSWLRFQPDSGLSRWYRRRFGSGGKRMRKIGIVALARRLMIALWRYLESGLVPEGARLKVA